MCLLGYDKKKKKAKRIKTEWDGEYNKTEMRMAESTERCRDDCERKSRRKKGNERSDRVTAGLVDERVY